MTPPEPVDPIAGSDAVAFMDSTTAQLEGCRVITGMRISHDGTFDDGLVKLRNTAVRINANRIIPLRFVESQVRAHRTGSARKWCAAPTKLRRAKMGEVIYFPNAGGSGRALGDDTGLTAAEVKRLEAIRDNVEALLNMVAGIRRDPEAVAYAAARFGLMRMYHLHGRAAAMNFADRCIETAEIAQDLDRV